jgi:molybdopterin synthase sulfur carrier subunit
MSTKIHIPSPLRQLTGGRAEVEVEGTTVGGALADLELRFPGFQARLFEADGSLRHFVNVYHNDEDIRTSGGLETALEAQDEISIVPAVAGGLR